MPPPVNIDDDGFITFMYVISGLSPGKDYAIRVRAQDSTGSLSLYTNILIYRTNMDQEDFDNEQRYTDWNERLNEELDKLAKEPSFILTNSSSVFTAWYRPSMFDGVISGTTDVTITLPPGSSVTSVYYLPQSVVSAANNANKGFKITNGNLELTIPSRAINIPDNSVVKEMDRRIRDRAIADYYIQITITWNDALNTYMGINHSVNIAYAGTGSTVTTRNLESEMTNIMLSTITNAKGNRSIHEHLRDLIRNNTPAEDIIKYIDTVVRDVRNSVSSDLNRRVINSRREPVSIQTLDRPFVLSVQRMAQGVAANAFYNEPSGGGWRPRDTMTIGSGRGIQSSATGLYGFAVREVTLPNAETLQNGGTATGIVAKYGLDVYLGQGSAFNLDENISKDKVVNSIAAVMGMPRGGSGYDFLRSRGYNISNRGGGSNITTQEAIHITMMLYEVKANVKVSAIQIRNQAATANIAGIDNAYRQSIRAAFELGIYTDRDMKANDPIKLRDFIQMLTNMDSRVRL
jgi:hypothetical protein